MDDKGITYERLFDYLREERTNIQLQQLPDSFYSDIITYLKLKEEQPGDPEQLKNAQKIIENIYERREKKILTLAISKSRTQSQLLDTSALLPEEKILFKQIVIVLNHYRDEILKKILKKEKPEVETETASPEKEEAVESRHTPGEIRVKMVQRVEKFVGPDLEIIGPFELGDVVSLPNEVAHELIERKVAERFGGQ